MGFEAKTSKDAGATTGQLREWIAFLKKYDGCDGQWKSLMRPMDAEEDYISAEKQFQIQKDYQTTGGEKSLSPLLRGHGSLSAQPWQTYKERGFSLFAQKFSYFANVKPLVLFCHIVQIVCFTGGSTI